MAMLRRALYVCALALLPLATLAAEPLGIVTGPKTGTYYAFGKDIEQVAARAGITIDVKSSEGSIDNIKRINSAENAALGIVQSDVLGFLSRSKNPGSMRMAGNLRMVFPLYNEEVHVLARKDIPSFLALNGKKVAVGEESSGDMLTAINLFSMMNIQPSESVKISPAQGVVAVLKGELDALIFVGGKPVRLFKNLEDLTLPENQKYSTMLDQVHFLAMDDPRMFEEYKPAEITPADYSFVQEARADGCRAGGDGELRFFARREQKTLRDADAPGQDHSRCIAFLKGQGPSQMERSQSRRRHRHLEKRQLRLAGSRAQARCGKKPG